MRSEGERARIPRVFNRGRDSVRKDEGRYRRGENNYEEEGRKGKGLIRLERKGPIKS